MDVCEPEGSLVYTANSTPNLRTPGVCSKNCALQRRGTGLRYDPQKTTLHSTGFHSPGHCGRDELRANIMTSVHSTFEQCNGLTSSYLQGEFIGLQPFSINSLYSKHESLSLRQKSIITRTFPCPRNTSAVPPAQQLPLSSGLALSFLSVPGSSAAWGSSGFSFSACTAPWSLPVPGLPCSQREAHLWLLETPQHPPAPQP